MSEENCIKNNCPVYAELKKTNSALEFEKTLLDKALREISELKAKVIRPEVSTDLQHLNAKDLATIEQFRTKK